MLLFLIDAARLKAGSTTVTGVGAAGCDRPKGGAMQRDRSL